MVVSREAGESSGRGGGGSIGPLLLLLEGELSRVSVNPAALSIAALNDMATLLPQVGMGEVQHVVPAEGGACCWQGDMVVSRKAGVLGKRGGRGREDVQRASSAAVRRDCLAWHPAALLINSSTEWYAQCCHRWECDIG